MKTKRIKPAGRPGKELTRALNGLARSHSMDRVYRDWLEMSAIAVSNSVDRAQYTAREERYMRIVKQYTRDEAHTLAEMFGFFVAELEITRECVFGPMMSELELHGNRKWMAQFFTPWNLCLMIAKMTVGTTADVQKMMADRGFFTAMEPACGAGAMIIGLARALEDLDINFQQCLHVTAVDIDPMCVHMTYLQTSLLGIPAIIIRGDSIRMTETEHWFTPLHILHGWNGRLRSTSTGLHQLPLISDALRGMSEAEKAAMDFIALEALPEIPEALAEGAGQQLEVMPLPDLPALAGNWQLRITPGASPPFDRAEPG